MKKRIPLSGKHLSRENRSKSYDNYYLVLQLYSFYKAEVVVKQEPRLPVNDWRRPVPEPKHYLPLLKQIWQQISAHISLRKVAGSFLSQAVPSALKN